MTHQFWAISQDLREVLRNQDAIRRDIRGLRKEIRALKAPKAGINWTSVFDHWLFKLLVLLALCGMNWMVNLNLSEAIKFLSR